MQAEKSTLLPVSTMACGMAGLTGYAHWCNSVMNLMVVINSFLIGFKIALQQRTHSWYYKPVAGEF